MKRRILKIFCMVLLISITATTVLADDGPMFRKNVSSNPENESEHAALRMLPLYVPPQSSDGTVLTQIDYLNADGAIVESREYVRPLIAHYTDGPVTVIDDPLYGGFPGHGERDAYGAVSLDDGASWNRTNLSNSADESSFKIKDGRKKIPYPGDVGRTFAASDGNKVLVVWVSRYCGSGNPTYAITDEERPLLASYLAATGTITDEVACTDGDPFTPCTYLEDSFGVAGSQGSSDLADEGLPLVGVLPYSCMWAARGTLQPPTAVGEPSTFTWFKAERLSSGVRDANRPEASCVKGAGCVVTWQEDPEGIRPGEGEGPGEGWSGAIAHHQTDTWYSYIDWDDFDLVTDETDTYGTFYDYPDGDLTNIDEWLLANPTGRPKAAVPMSIPMRLTDNAMCSAIEEDDSISKAYCHIDYDGNEIADFCAYTVPVDVETPEGPTATIDMCVTEDGRLMRGNTAATRARLGLHGYSSVCAYDKTNPEACPIDSAWFSMSYEENKGLGEDGEEVEVSDDPAEKVDMGKNVWYHTFDMFTPELVSQGLMLNQPAIYPDDFSDPLGLLTQDTSLGYNFFAIDPDPIYETQGGLETTLYQTEISRRPSPISQDWYDAGETGTVAFHLWKQGIIRRGGPADIMGRRFVIPDEFDASVDNPYDYANMVCDNWAFTDGTNPRYIKGLCASPAVNLSGNTIQTGECGDTAACQDAFPFSDYFDDLAGGTAIPKIWEWEQYGPGYGASLPFAPEDTSLDDTSWENPYDVAKGHRGFLAGDMLLTMYAWSPNWMANTVGHDNYNLYNRRSFDGGQTWSTLPASFTHTDGITYSGDGTITCEWMGPAGSDTEYPVCTDYGAGDFEQTRNVSQLVGTKVTILDPRYAPTTRGISEASVSTASLPEGFFAPLYEDDVRDASLYFMVYETGDNTTVEVGEAVPLDLFYSRAINWGDDYLVWQDEATTDCLPAAENTDLAGFCNEFDALEGGLAESGEASITTSPGGTFFYAAWNQLDFDMDGHEIGSDVWFRRVLFLNDYNPLLDISLTIEIASPVDGAMFDTGSEIDFSGTADDLVDGNLSEYIEWTSNIDGDIGIGTSVSASLSDGEHTITASVMDNDGNVAKAKIVIIVSPDENPVVEIDSPDDGAMFVSGSEIDFSGTADDLEDGTTLSSEIEWVSDLDGAIGTGANFSAVLSDGDHTITASVTDSDGLSGSASIDITVYPFPGATPIVVIDKPDEESIEAFTEISFYATADDLEDGVLNNDIVWASDLDGVIGSGASIKAVLSGPVGEETTDVVHTITASVTDSDGNLGSISIALTIVPKPNDTPIVEIGSPDDGAMFVSGSEINFSGTADDLEDGNLSSTIAWKDNGVSLGTGASVSAVLSDGDHTITATVTDQYGLTGSASIDITVYPLPGDDPNVVIDTPAANITFDWGTKIFFSATANDPEDGTLNTEIVWESSIDGVIGTGPTINLVLSGPDGVEPVVHTITASVLDSDGNSASTSIDLTINPNELPTILIDNPADGADFVYGTAIEFSGTANDLEDGVLNSDIVWVSSLDGEIGTGDSFITTELSVGTHAITASVIDDGGLEAYDVISVTVSNVPNTQALTVDVTTIDPYEYLHGDTVRITTTVTDQNANLVEAAEVTVAIEFHSLTIFRTAETDASGVAVVTYKINTRKTGIGEATVTVTATKLGYEAGDDTGIFEVIR